jgi:aerobic-type carbon monoxide dehydrogenase small subunit (CoxS/CutS family)
MSAVTELNINGRTLPASADSERSLLSVLRDDLDFTGSKYGCGEGHCGACTVLVDGAPTRSCVTKVGKVQSARITTIEGVAQEGRLHPLQTAFLEAGAMQCAYCASGMIMSAYALLAQKPNPSERDIFRAMEGNVCRCGTYQRIVSAIQSAAKNLKNQAP